MRKDQLIKKVARELKISQVKAEKAIKIILGAGAITKKQEIKVVTVEKQIPIEVIKEVMVLKTVEVSKEVIKKSPPVRKTAPFKKVKKATPPTSKKSIKKAPPKAKMVAKTKTVAPPKKKIATKAKANPKAKTTSKTKVTTPQKVAPSKKITAQTISPEPKLPRKVDPRFSKFKISNFQIIEGIGPKIEELLYRAKIKNWSQLAETPPDYLKKILEAAGNRFKVHDPSTWGKQAEMAKSGRWKELIKYQKILDAGKTNRKNRRTPSKVERMANIIK